MHCTPYAAQAMNTPHPQTPTPPTDPVPNLVARVFEESPLALRGRLLEHLLKPLGLLSLAAVANGVFAQITLGNGWSELKISADDAKRVDVSDIVALVHHVQQVSVRAMDSLAGLISTSPVLAGSATAAMLLAILAKRAQARSPVLGNDFDPIG
jgi:hypothetical protein